MMWEAPGMAKSGRAMPRLGFFSSFSFLVLYYGFETWKKFKL